MPEEIEPTEPTPLPPGIKSVTLTIGHRCPTCGELPEDFRGKVERHVNLQWHDPSKGVRYVLDPDGNPETYEQSVIRRLGQPPPGVLIGIHHESPPGLYPGITLPRYLLGKIVVIIPKDEYTKSRGGPMRRSLCEMDLFDPLEAGT